MGIYCMWRLYTVTYGEGNCVPRRGLIYSIQIYANCFRFESGDGDHGGGGGGDGSTVDEELKEGVAMWRERVKDSVSRDCRPNKFFLILQRYWDIENIIRVHVLMLNPRKWCHAA